MNRPHWILIVPVLLSVAPLLRGQQADGPCRISRLERTTDDFRFTASSDQGAVGDVVAVDIFLSVETLQGRLFGFELVPCYDKFRAEMAGDIQYTEAFDQLVWRSTSTHLESAGKKGIYLNGNMFADVAERLFSGGGTVHFATVFLRLQGAPGDSFEFGFSSEEFRRGEGSCYRNTLNYEVTQGEPPVLNAFSTRHVPGTLRIVDGPATRPDPPALPPLARVYPEAPTPETARIHFELSGAVARPGATDVRMDVHVTSNLEFSGFALSVPFPARYLELARVTEHTRPGAVRIDNETGYLAMLMANSRRRIGAEGERVRLITLHFNVKPEAAEVFRLEPRLEDHRRGGVRYFNWLAIHHHGGPPGVAGELPVTAEVSPLIVTNAALAVQRQGTYPGDVNLDYELDLTDAVVILGDLFLGEEGTVCPPAADFNQDGAVNISDPIGILQYLFVGSLGALEQSVFCDG